MSFYFYLIHSKFHIFIYKWKKHLIPRWLEGIFISFLKILQKKNHIFFPFFKYFKMNVLLKYRFFIYYIYSILSWYLRKTPLFFHFNI